MEETGVVRIRGSRTHRARIRPAEDHRGPVQSAGDSVLRSVIVAGVEHIEGEVIGVWPDSDMGVIHLEGWIIRVDIRKEVLVILLRRVGRLGNAYTFLVVSSSHGK